MSRTLFELERETCVVRKYLRGRVGLFLLRNRDTPVMVELRADRENPYGPSTFATYECAVGERAVEGCPLTEAQCNWLESKRPTVEKWWKQMEGKS